MDKVEIVKEVVEYLERERRIQSMSEDFQDGFDYAIRLIQRFVGIDTLSKKNE